jgi:hypothetical protein
MEFVGAYPRLSLSRFVGLGSANSTQRTHAAAISNNMARCAGISFASRLQSSAYF